MVSQPRRCSSITTSLPSSPEPSSMTLVAEGDSGVPRAVIGVSGCRAREGGGGVPGPGRRGDVGASSDRQADEAGDGQLVAGGVLLDRLALLGIEQHLLLEQDLLLEEASEL